ncbi:MAG: hypothetical protein ABGZ17_29960, partial [Planctomycetaceae bacterium]
PSVTDPDSDAVQPNPINPMEGEHMSQSDSYAIEFGAGISMDADDDCDQDSPQVTPTHEEQRHAETDDNAGLPASDTPPNMDTVVFEFGADTDEHSANDHHEDEAIRPEVTPALDVESRLASPIEDPSDANIPPTPIEIGDSVVHDRVELESETSTSETSTSDSSTSDSSTSDSSTSDSSTSDSSEDVTERVVFDRYANLDAQQSIEPPIASHLNSWQTPSANDTPSEEQEAEWLDAPLRKSSEFETSPTGGDAQFESDDHPDGSLNLIEDIMPLVNESITTMEQLASSGDWVTTTGLERLTQVADAPQQSTSPADSLSLPNSVAKSPETTTTDNLESEVGNELLGLCQEVHLTMSHAPNARRSRVGRVAAELQEVLNNESHVQDSPQFDVVEPESQIADVEREHGQTGNDRISRLFSRVRRQRYSDNQLH